MICRAALLFLAAASAVLLSVTAGAAAQPGPAQPPSFLFLLGDDIGSVWGIEPENGKVNHWAVKCPRQRSPPSSDIHWSGLAYSTRVDHASLAGSVFNAPILLWLLQQLRRLWLHERHRTYSEYQQAGLRTRQRALHGFSLRWWVQDSLSNFIFFLFAFVLTCFVQPL